MPSSSLRRNLLSPPRRIYHRLIYRTLDVSSRARHSRKSRFIRTRALDFQMRETSRDQLPSEPQNVNLRILFPPRCFVPRVTKVTRHFHASFQSLCIFAVLRIHIGLVSYSEMKTRNVCFRKQRCTVKLIT